MTIPRITTNRIIADNWVAQKKKIGRLTIVGVANSRVTSVVCDCECGSKKNVTVFHLKQLLVLSCGCLHDDMLGVGSRTHGLSKTREYKIWK